MASTPVVFIHGLWLHATSWDPWVELFGDAGYAPLAPGWPGEPDTVAEAREHPEYVVYRKQVPMLIPRMVRDVSLIKPTERSRSAAAKSYAP